MERLTASLLDFARAIGGPGLFLIAFLDSSLLSLPEINDLLIIWMVTQHTSRMVYYASMATLGSVAGCLTLYLIGSRGGFALLQRRFDQRHLDRAMALSRRYGALAIIVPALLPPPAPFKIFVLMAGVARVPVWTFVLSVTVGRGVRYFGEGLLAVWYGELAIAWLRANGRRIGIALAVAAFAGGVAYLVWTRSRLRGVRGRGV